MTDLTPEQLVGGQLDAYNAQDLDKFCGYFSDDILITSYLGDIVCEGMKAFRERHVGIFSDFPSNKAKLLHRIVLGDTVIDHEDVDRGNGDKSFQVGCIYTIKNGLISRIEYVKAS
ncbi:nuclear transport factor 2 family protein [Hirschia maritima]|uniref:nuclear transport factor 2 family protein n=1 Tax=Hirschia maritima TaxID=1121961 RepID=UPI00036862E8|nr:nuclear transport factor 2 family protein [Hirschia maritima]